MNGNSKKHLFEHGEANPGITVLVCMCMCMHLCVCMCVRQRALCVHVCVHVHVQAYICACVCASVPVCMFVCVCARACMKPIPTIFLYYVSPPFFFLRQSLSEPGAYQLHYTSWPVNSRSPPPYPGVQTHTTIPSLLRGRNQAWVLS